MEHVKALVGALLLLSVAAALAPLREGIRRAVTAAFSVIFILLLLPKDLSFDPHSLLFPLSKGEAADTETYEELLEDSFEEGLAASLSERFSIKRECIRLDARLVGEEMRPAHVSVTLSGEGVTADATGIVSYLTACYGCTCEIRIEG